MASPEIVIYDDVQNRELGDTAFYIAKSLKLVSFFSTDAEEVSHQAGLYTRGVVTSDMAAFGRFRGLSPFTVSDLLEIPRLVFVDRQRNPSEYVRSDYPDLAVRRTDDHLEKRIEDWFKSLPIPRI
ncbi:MAG: hypothetical protein M3Q79_00980 [bacterium]|nr:hypothetical protein [bacterium]